MNKSKVLLIILTIFLSNVKANSDVDSIISVFNDKTKSDDLRFSAIKEIAWDYLFINPDSAYLLSTYAYNFAVEINNKKFQAKALNTQGVSFYIRGNLSIALEYYLKGLVIKEELNDTLGIAKSYNNIGIIHDVENDFDKALYYLEESLRLKKLVNYSKGISSTLNNIGSVYSKKGDFEKAKFYFEESLRTENGDNKQGMANSYGSLGTIYKDVGEFEKSLLYHNKALKIEKEIENNEGISGTLINIGVTYAAYSEFDKAKKYCLEGNLISVENGYLNLESGSCHCLSIAYKGLGENYNALINFERFIRLRDSIVNEETNLSIIQKEVEFDYHKKVIADSLLNQQQKEIQKIAFDKKIQAKNIITYSVLLGLILVIIFSYIIFNRLKLVREQKVIIEKANNEILASINYAKRIQSAVLPEIKLSHLFEDSFLIYKPKDVVSGDFYWWERAGDKILFAIADCTGHGVPGGFMSMLGSIFSNEIFNSKQIYQPSLILDELSKLMRISLKNADGDLIKDGMDISFGCLDTKTLKMEWAGANNPLYIIKNKETDLDIIKGDRQPIGFFHSYKPFTNHVIQLEKGDKFYLFSDGLADQFGGEKGKRITSKKVQELLISNSSKSMKEQGAKLDVFFEKWRGNEEQIDDVAFIGVKV